MVDRGTFSKMNQDLSFVDEKVLSFVPVSQSRILPSDFLPNNWTVICGRGKASFNHVGNRRFRILCEINERKYEQATTKTEKSLIVMNIVDAIREGSGGGGFVKQDPFTKEWFEVSDSVAREKVGQQLRENLSKKSSKATKTSTAQAETKKRKHNDSTTITSAIATQIARNSPSPSPVRRASNASQADSFNSEILLYSAPHQSNVSEQPWNGEQEFSRNTKQMRFSNHCELPLQKPSRHVSPVAVTDCVEWDGTTDLAIDDLDNMDELSFLADAFAL